MMRAFLAKRNFVSKLKKFKSQDSTATEPVGGHENGKENDITEENEKNETVSDSDKPDEEGVEPVEENVDSVEEEKENDEPEEQNVTEEEN